MAVNNEEKIRSDAFDISGEEKKRLTVEDLLEKFNNASGEEVVNDRMILG